MKVFFNLNCNHFILFFFADVTEVSFQSETHATAATTTVGLTTKEYIAIAICSLLLGLIYVASVFLYLHVKKRKSRNSTNASPVNTTSMKNDQVTFGAGFSRNGSVISSFGGKLRSGSMISGSSRRDSGRLQQASSTVTGNGRNANGEEMGIIKNNPLLKHYPNLNDNSGFVSDLSNSNSECDDDHNIDTNGIIINVIFFLYLFIINSIIIFNLNFRCHHPL